MSGQVSNLVQVDLANMDDYCGYELEIIAILFLILNTAFLISRFYTRCIIIGAKMEWDDYLILPAYLTVLGLCILGIVTLKVGGVGHHVVAIYFSSPDKIETLLKCLVAISYIYLTAEALTRIAICCLYLRIFQDRKVRCCIYGILAVILANWVAYMVAFSLACRPFSYLWKQFQDPGERGAECFDITALYKSIGFPAVAIDIALLIVPVPSIVALKLPIMQKIAITIVFLTGSLGLISSILRMAIFFRASPLNDITWTANELQIWSIVEPGMYFVAACMVALRPLFVKYIPARVREWLRKLSAREQAVLPPTLRTQTDHSRPHLPIINSSGLDIDNLTFGGKESFDMESVSSKGAGASDEEFDLTATLENEKWRCFHAPSRHVSDVERGWNIDVKGV